MYDFSASLNFHVPTSGRLDGGLAKQDLQIGAGRRMGIYAVDIRERCAPEIAVDERVQHNGEE